MIRRAQPWLGTLVDIALVQPARSDMSDVPDAPDRSAASVAGVAAAASSAIDAAFAAVALVHRRMSFHDAGSDVGAINRLAPGESCLVDPHTSIVLRCALMLEQASDGLFNIACADALTAWGQLPAPAASASASASAASSVAGAAFRSARAVLAVDADSRVTRLRPGAIDLGGIAKGYAVDLAVAALQAAGVISASVNAGGDLRTFGPAGIKVAIRDPARPSRVGHELMLRDTALATSAGYFSRRVVDGVDSTALLDTVSGHPVLHVRSASVLAPTCMLADGLTKPVIASADPAHPTLAHFGATALLL